jgi:hypothetical protein
MGRSGGIVRIYKVEFFVVNKNDEDDKPVKGWYYFEESISQVTDYIKELFEDEDIEVTDLRVLMLESPGWKELEIERSA